MLCVSFQCKFEELGSVGWGNINYGDCCDIGHLSQTSPARPAQVTFVFCLKQDQTPTGFNQ